jgi:Rhodanese-like domain
VILAALLFCVAAQAAPQAPPAQPRYPVDPANGRAIGATEMAPEAVRGAAEDGRRMVIIDTRPAEAFAKETLPGAVNIPLAEIDARLADYSKDTLLVFT